MNGIIALLEVWALMLITTLIGRRFVALLPASIERVVDFYIAPIVGLGVLVLGATFYGWFLPFDFKLVTSIISIIVALAFIYEPKKKAALKACIYVCGFAALCSIPVLAPMFKYGGYNPFTDIFTYIAQAQWLQEHPFSEKVITSGNFPAFTQVYLYQETGSRMGGTFLLGFVQALFNCKWSYFAYIPAVATALVTGCLALGGIVRQVVPSPRIVILALALIPSLTMNGFIFGAEWGFYPQTLGLSFALGFCAIFPAVTKAILNSKIKFSQIFLYSLPAAICFAALLFAYNEPFPVFVASLLLFVIISAISYRHDKIALKNLSFLVICFGLQVLILVNYEIIRIFINIYQTLTVSNGIADIGWPVLWSPLQFLAFAFGMKSPFNRRPFTFDYFYSTFCAAIVIAVTLITLIWFLRTYPKRRENIIFLLCLELVLFIFLVKFRYFAADKSALEVGHTFLQFKISKYMAPFSLTLLAIVAAFFYCKLRAKRRLLLIIYAVLFIIGVWFHAKISAKNYTSHFLRSVQQFNNPFGVLLDLREAVKDIPKDSVIYIDLGYDNHKLRQMLAYVFYDRKIASDYRDDGYIHGRLPEQDRNMSKDGAYKCIFMRDATNIEDGTLVGPFVVRDC